MKKVVSALSLFLLAAGLMLAAGCNEGKTDKKPVDKQSNAADKGDDLSLGAPACWRLTRSTSSPARRSR